MSEVFSPLLLSTEDLAEVLEAVGSRWNVLRGKRLLLTGGTGFIGKWLLGTFLHANRARQLDAKLVILSRNVDAFLAQFPELDRADDIEWLQGDIRDFTLSAGAACDFAIHAATDVMAAISAADVLDTCISGTARLLSAMRYPGSRRVLLLSSGAVYGRTPPEVTHIPEDWRGAPDPLMPASAYGEGKRVSELLGVIAAQESKNLEVIAARGFAFVGPHLPLDKQLAIGNFIAAAMRNEDIHIQGDGTPLRSYMYATDLAHWLWVLLFEGINGRAYNVGGKESLSIAQLARRVNIALGSSGAIHIARKPEPGTPVQTYVPALDRIAAELGLSPRVGLDDAIRRTARWAKQCIPHYEDTEHQ